MKIDVFCLTVQSLHAHGVHEQSVRLRLCPAGEPLTCPTGKQDADFDPALRQASVRCWAPRCRLRRKPLICDQLCSRNFRSVLLNRRCFYTKFAFQEQGPHLYQTCPSANYVDCKAMAIGARSQSARTYLEKYLDAFPACNLEELIKHGLRALRDTLPNDVELTAKVSRRSKCLDH